MWREILMNASWLVALILALVGVIKTPFKSFKEKKPKLFRATFFVLSLIFVVAGSIIVELYILEDTLLTWSFVALLLSTGVGVFGGYSAYENLSIKALFHKIFESIKNWKNNYSDTKVAKFIDKVGLDRILEVNEKSQPITEETPITEVEVEQPAKTEEKLTAEIIEETNNIQN